MPWDISICTGKAAGPPRWMCPSALALHPPGRTHLQQRALNVPEGRVARGRTGQRAELKVGIQAPSAKTELQNTLLGLRNGLPALTSRYR